MSTLEGLPEELLKQIFQWTASILGVRKIGRLRTVSRLFDVQIKDALIYAGLVNDFDIVKCPDKDFILKYLSWRLATKLPIGINNHGETIEIFRTSTELFVSKSNSKYSFDTTLKSLLSLFADEIISQQLLYHRQSVKTRTPGTYEPIPETLCCWTSVPISPEQICLNLASALGDEELVLELIASSEAAEPLAGGDLLASPLGTAIRNRQKHIVRLILSRTPTDSAEWHGRHRCLMEAVLSGDLDILKMLLALRNAYTTDLNWDHEDQGQNPLVTALVTACTMDNLPALKLLLEKVPFNLPYPPWFQNRLLFWACLGTSLTIARFVFNEHPHLSPNFAGYWTRGLLPIEPGDRRSTPLQEAARRGSSQLVELLIRHGAEPRKPFYEWLDTPIFEASKRGHHRCVRALLDAKPMKRPRGVKFDEPTPIFAAVRSGSAVTVKMLLEEGYGHPVLKLKDAMASLAFAYIEGVQSIINMFIELGVDSREAIIHAKNRIDPLQGRKRLMRAEEPIEDILRE